MGKNVEGSDNDLIYVRIPTMPGGTEDNHENPQSNISKKHYS
jgi:hypothetical protein